MNRSLVLGDQRTVTKLYYNFWNHDDRREGLMSRGLLKLVRHGRSKYYGQQFTGVESQEDGKFGAPGLQFSGDLLVMRLGRR